jgi:hypothetical protein
MSKQKRNQENVQKMRQRGDLRFDQTYDNSSHLSNAEFARDFEACCDVEFGREFENNFVNDQFGEENLRRNNLEAAREFNINRARNRK